MNVGMKLNSCFTAKKQEKMNFGELKLTDTMAGTAYRVNYPNSPEADQIRVIRSNFYNPGHGRVSGDSKIVVSASHDLDTYKLCPDGVTATRVKHPPELERALSTTHLIYSDGEGINASNPFFDKVELAFDSPEKIILKQPLESK